MLLPDIKPSFRFWRFFFSPQGRVSRLAIWAFVLPVRLSLLAIDLTMQAIGFPMDSINTYSSTPWYMLSMVKLAIIVVTMWPIFAILAKRLHDIGWTFLPALAAFMPIIGGILVFIYLQVTDEFPPNPIIGRIQPILNDTAFVLALVLAFIPGQRTTNRFGPPVTGPADNPAHHF